MGSNRRHLELRVSYRSILVVLAGAVVVALAIAWVAGTRQAVVVGSGAHAGSGVWLNRCGPGSADDLLYPSSKDVVAVQTVRNDGRWTVEVISKEPSMIRFGPLAEDRRDDVNFPSPDAGVPDEVSDRVTIPPGREVAMWITDPFPDMSSNGGYTGIETIPVRVSSLGVSHETTIDLRHMIWMGGGRFDTERLEAAFDEVCGQLNG